MCSYSSIIQKGSYTYARVAQSVRASVLCTGGRGFNPHRVQFELFLWLLFFKYFLLVFEKSHNSGIMSPLRYSSLVPETIPS